MHHRPRRGHPRQVDERTKKAIGLVFTEIPYQVNKTKLIERIADLVREKTIEGISDLRDESDREGMRIVVDSARRSAGSFSTISTSTPPAVQFGMSCWPSSAAGPVMSPPELVGLHITARGNSADRDSISKRARYHILEGLESRSITWTVITLIRSAKTAQARDGLMTRSACPLPGAGDSDSNFSG
jgi:DNA gyrase subunit A